MSVCGECCVCCQVEVYATGWSLVQRRPTDCGVSLCVKPREWGGRCPLGGCRATRIRRRKGKTGVSTSLPSITLLSVMSV